MTQIDEQWLEIDRSYTKFGGFHSIVRISNTGKYEKKDGTKGILKLKQPIRTELGRIPCSHIIAEHFLITVKRPDQTIVDHISHNPSEYNVNDVRNLRWCTIAENNTFEEARENKSKALSGDMNPMYGMTGEKAPMYGRNADKCPNWKGNNAGANHLYYRALKEYRRNPTEENLATLNEARLRRQEQIRHLRRAKKSRQ